MSKKKHPEHVNHERWLVSYADFITLLFAFFVVLFASGQADKKKQQKFASAFNAAFSQMALFSPASKKPALSDSSGANPNAQPMPIELPLQVDATGHSPRRPDGVLSSQTELHAHLDRVVQQLLGDQNSSRFDNGSPTAATTPGKESTSPLPPGSVSVREVHEGIAVTLEEGGFFDSGSAALRPEAVPALTALAASLPGGDIRVEGHTDNQPIHSAQFASNWELSSARAQTIARFLLLHSALNPAHLAVAGYAEFHPLTTNSTPAGRAQNRRVEIVFLKVASGH